MSYMADGRPVARAVFLHQTSDYYGMRSFIYSLGILPFHWNFSPWPVVALQCLLAAFVVWLVMRAVLPRRSVPCYLGLMFCLSLLTSASWYSSIVLPDILGPLAYLAFFLLVFARDSLSRRERYALYGIAWWGLTAHSTHFMLAAGLCLLVALMLTVERRPLRRIVLPTAEVAAIVLVAALAQLALHGYLYGKPSLNGERPPYLMARIVADGPGRWYLEKNCGHLTWFICGHLDHLADNPDDFLWAPDGIWQTDTDEENKQLVREEMPLVLATMRAYPREQLARSSRNFWDQLNRFGLFDLEPSDWVGAEFGRIMPAAQTGYTRGRQAHNALPLELFSDTQYWVVLACLGLVCLGMVAGFISRIFPHRPVRLLELGVIVLVMPVANGLLTGVLSMPDDRYEARVIWLLPMLAGLMGMSWLSRDEQETRQLNSEFAR